MSKVRGLELERHLAEAPVQPVYALVGEDDALRARSLRLLERAAAPPELPGSTVRCFEELPEARDVFDELRTVPFMGLEGRRVVVVERAERFMAANAEALLRYITKPSRSSTLILCLAGLAAPKKPKGAKGEEPSEQPEQEDRRAKLLKELLKALKAGATVVDCAKVSWGEARSWARGRAGEMGKKLTPRAAYALVEALGPDLLALGNELDKLCAYVGTEETITEGDVEEMAPQGRSRSVFELGNALARGDGAEAMRLAERLLLRGERISGIISVLALQVRQFWQVKRLQARGVSEREVARQTRMRDFAVKKAWQPVRRLSDDWFATRLAVLADADWELKTTAVRSQEEGVWLGSLLARLCGQERSGRPGGHYR